MKIDESEEQTKFGFSVATGQIWGALFYDTLPIHHYEHHFLEFQTRIYENIYFPEEKYDHKTLVRNEGTSNIH